MYILYIYIYTVYIYIYLFIVVFYVITLSKIIFWDVTPCSSVKVHRHYGGIYCLHLQGRNVSHANNEPEKGGIRKSRASWLLLHPEDGSSAFFCNVGRLLPDYMASHPRILLLFIAVVLRNSCPTDAFVV
jgi:hypothetical protein